ncbi:MAG: phosphinothricin acetyltransferase [Flavipsychrobacter sp.]|nr:phosphinothricin acetyltransferase [Flavipsychrobacter sp.]
MSGRYNIRLIDIIDAEATLAIYRPYVENTIISFEYEAPTLEEWHQRIAANTAGYPWLVCEVDGVIAGYAYGSTHRYRTAYSWSVESTVYVSEQFHRQGIARVLYETLLALLRIQGYMNVYAGIGMPNVKSESFHRALGFYDIGTFKKIGYKFGAWHDTLWLQLHLAEHTDNQPFPKKTAEVAQSTKFIEVIENANRKINQVR